MSDDNFVLRSLPDESLVMKGGLARYHYDMALEDRLSRAAALSGIMLMDLMNAKYRREDDTIVASRWVQVIATILNETLQEAEALYEQMPVKEGAP